MKKKILSTLLAACLFVGIAIPSVMAATSDVAGDAKKVTKITMIDDKSSYDIEVGNAGAIDFKDKIAVYENETKLVLDHNHIRYMLNGNTGSGNTGDFRIEGSVVTAIKAGSTATLTIFDNYNASSNARVTITLKSVAPSAAFTEVAESFTFDASSYNVPYNNGGINVAEDVKLNLVAHPKGSAFRASDNALELAQNNVVPRVAAALGLGTVTGAATVVGTGVDGLAANLGTDGVITVTLAAAAVTAGQEVVFTIGDKVFKHTPGALADDTAKAAALAALIGSPATINGIEYAVAANAGTVTFTATKKKLTDLPAMSYTVAGTAEGITGAITTVGVDVVAATKGTVTYDFTKAAPLKEGDTITIGGVGSVVVGKSQTTVEQQLQLWIANRGANTILGANEVADLNGRVITMTAAATGALPITAAMKATNFPNGADTTKLLTYAECVAKGISAAYSVTDGAPDYKAIVITVSANFLNTAANKDAAKAVVHPYTWTATSKAVSEVKMNKFGGQVGQFTATTNVIPMDAIAATSISFGGNTDVIVGKTTDIAVTYYPPNANVNKNAQFEIVSALNDGKPYQYAIISDKSANNVVVKGVNSNTPAKAVLVGRIANGTLTSNITINVKATDYKPAGTEGFTSKISKTTVETKVGAVTPLVITDMPAGVTVKWVYNDNGVITLSNNNKATTAIFGKKVGTTTIKATLSNGETFNVAVTVAAADVKAPVTDVPQTGDSLFNF